MSHPAAVAVKTSPHLIQPEGMDAELIRQHRKKIEFSDTFNDLEHQRRLILFLIEQRLAGRHEQMTQTEIAGANLLAAASTPQKPELLFPDEQAVRTHISRLRRTLLAYYRYEAPSEKLRIDVPMRKYVAVFSYASSPAIPGTPPPPAPEPDSRSAESLNKAAVALYAKGRYEEAETILNRVLAFRQESLGPDHPDTATSVNNLAMLYEKQGRYREAVPLLERALEICERVLGPDHPDTIIGVNNLAIAYISQARYPEALPLLQRALGAREQLLGQDHPDTATSLNNLAMLYEKQGRYAEAVPLLQRAITVREKSLGPEHPDTANSLNNLAMVYKRQARFRDAAVLSQRALEICEKVLGPEHPQTAIVRSNHVDLSEV